MPSCLKPVQLWFCLALFYCVMPSSAQSSVSDFNLVRQELEYQEQAVAILERLKSHITEDYDAGMAALSNKLRGKPLPLYEKIELYKALIYLHFSFDEQAQVIRYANELLAIVQSLPNPRYANFSRLVLIAEANNVSRDSRLKNLDKFFAELPVEQQNDVKFYYFLFKAWLDRRSNEALTLNLYLSEDSKINGSEIDSAIALHMSYIVEDVPEMKFAFLNEYLDLAEKHDIPVKYVVHYYNVISYILYVLGDQALVEPYTDHYLQYALGTEDQSEIFFAYLKKAQQLTLARRSDEGLRLIHKARQFQNSVSKRWQLQLSMLEAEQFAILGRLAEAETALAEILSELVDYEAEPPPDIRRIKALIDLQKQDFDNALIEITDLFQSYRNILNVDRLNYLREINTLRQNEHLAFMNSEENLVQVEYRNNLLSGAIALITILLITLAVLMMKQRKIHHTVVALSQRDSLTQLSNRGYWQQCLEQTLWQHQQSPENTSCLLLIDVDHFKHINDKYGHTTGDQVLKQVAQLILASSRQSDYAGRYGGEEFALILSASPLTKAREIAERLRKNIADFTFDGVDGDVTVSIGIAEFNAAYLGITDWINAADTALYNAKRQGRNQVVFA